MKLSELWGKKQVGKQTRKALIFLIPSFILTAIMIFVTFYGQDTGDFSIGIDKETHQKNISISTNANSKENKKIIRAKARPIQPISSAAIKARYLDEILKNPGGSYHTQNFISYTFYLKNESELSFSIGYNLIVTEAERQEVTDQFKIDKSIRIMLVDEKNISIYQSEQSNDTLANQTFNQGPVIIKENGIHLNPKEEKKFTIIFWFDILETSTLEEMPESIKFQMVFKIDEGH